MDQAVRSKLANPDAAWSLFHFGYATDERISDRLAWHRQHQHDPKEVLGPLSVPRGPRMPSRRCLPTWASPRSPSLRRGRRKVELTEPSAPKAAPLLAAALLPIATAYPMLFVEIAG
ncbi:MAG: hypothetical protein CVU63_12155 [Deltaproteobacteria bacterium HGW-Deltaproteobacteria-20]|nr:MAG: hypothetical protein CVU63_12155 [Deltaproteobacteria bacterium HGW-Deltaproteobacteria-20]